MFAIKKFHEMIYIFELIIINGFSDFSDLKELLHIWKLCQIFSSITFNIIEYGKAVFERSMHGE